MTELPVLAQNQITVCSYLKYLTVTLPHREEQTDEIAAYSPL
jgi:hypothetical protein